MGDAKKYDLAKKERARRSRIIKDLCLKRQRYTPQQEITFNNRIRTPNLLTIRTPLSELTPLPHNQKIVAQIVEEGKILSAQFQGYEPSESRHGFKPTKKSYKVHTLGNNLLSKFTNSITCETKEYTDLTSKDYLH